MPANPRTDPVTLAVSLLEANWDPANTGDGTPGIVDDASGVKLSRRGAGAVTVYQGPTYSRERTDTPGDFKTHRFPVLIVFEATSRAKLLELSGEIERIYGNVKNDPDAYWDWIEDLGETQVKDYPQAFEANTTWEFRASSRSAAT